MTSFSVHRLLVFSRLSDVVVVIVSWAADNEVFVVTWAAEDEASVESSGCGG